MHVRKYKKSGIIKVNTSTVRGKYVYPVIKLPLEFDFLIGHVVKISENAKEVTLRISKISNDIESKEIKRAKTNDDSRK